MVCAVHGGGVSLYQHLFPFWFFALAGFVAGLSGLGEIFFNCRE
jgi:hypothetical protein